MKKFINHVDHVAWISRPETLEANVALLENITGARLQRFQRADMGFVMYISWEAGLEVVSPLPERTDFNKVMYDNLAIHGDSVTGVVFGVRGLEQHKARLEALGVPVGPFMDDHQDSPWHHKLVLRERIAGTVMKAQFVLGDIDYAEGVISFEDAPEGKTKKLVNHIDHVVWVSAPGTLAANRGTLEKFSGVELQHVESKDLGISLDVNWEAGFTIISPAAEVNDLNKELHSHLQTHGDSVFAVVFGVQDLEKHKARLEGREIGVGPLWDDRIYSRWRDKLVLRARPVGTVMKSRFFLGDIDYREGVITMEDA